MKPRSLLAALLFSATVAAVAAAPARNPILDYQLARAAKAAPGNRARVAADWKAAGRAGDVAWYAVPAMSDVMRLHDTYPADGRAAGELRAVVAQEGFASLSFELFAFRDFERVELEVSPLALDGATNAPPLSADLRVVKLWLQNGNGWISFFADRGLKLVPELLLHDEGLVEVDLKRQANYARLGDGTKVWISPPAEIDARRLDPFRDDFRDADSIQPVALGANAFKQFFLTVGAARDQRPGVYRGKVVAKAGGATLCEIPVALRVLPFALPLPKQWGRPDAPYLPGCIDFNKFDAIVRRMDGDRARATAFYRNYLKSLRDHGILYPSVQQDAESYALLRELGFPLKPVVSGKSFAPWDKWLPGTRFGFLMDCIAGARKCAEYYRALVGHTDIVMTYGDEEPALHTVLHRSVAEIYRLVDPGLQVGCSGTWPIIYKAGWAYAINPTSGRPEDPERVRVWREIGGDCYSSPYALQHTGCENPQFVRMQHGLAPWLAGHGMSFNYEFAIGPWNDLVKGAYKPMVIAYADGAGIVETLAWNGFREGVDDIRYASYLQELVDAVKRRGDQAAYLEGKKALQFLALQPLCGMDLDAVRMEVIERILRLREMAGQGDAAAVDSRPPATTVADNAARAPAMAPPHAAAVEGICPHEMDDAAARALLAEAAACAASNTPPKAYWRGPITDNFYGTEGFARAAELCLAAFRADGAAVTTRLDAVEGYVRNVCEAHAVVDPGFASLREGARLADGVIREAAAMPGLSGADERRLAAIASDFYYKTGDYPQALDWMKRSEFAAMAGGQRLWNYRCKVWSTRFVEVYERIHGEEAAYAALKTGELDRYIHPIHFAQWLLAHGRRDEALAMAEKAMDDPSVAFYADWLMFYQSALDDLGFDAFAEKFPPRLSRFFEINPRGWRSWYDRLTAWRKFSYGTSVVGNDSRWGDWIYDFVANVPTNVPAASRPPAHEIYQAALRGRRPEKAAEAARAVVASTNAPAADALSARLLLAVHDAKTPGAALKAVLTAIGGDADGKARLEGLTLAARHAMRMGREEVARALDDARWEAIARSPREIACPYRDDIPADISGILSSDLWLKRPRGVLDRKYGDNLDDLLATDMAGAARTVTKDDGTPFRPTEFTAFCNRDGLCILLFAYCDDADAVAAGDRRIGGYEGYLATDPGEPYTTFIADPPRGAASDAFITQYPNGTGYRKPSVGDGTMKVEHQCRKDGVATLLTFSWKPFFRAIPENGTRWHFEAIHWEQGGWSWGGSRSVHNNSSFGALVFTGLDAVNRRAVKRTLVREGLAAFRRARDPNANGCLDFWRDPKLGDRAFYFARLKALEDDLCAWAERAKPGMADADIDAVFDNAVFRWLNVDYIVARERAAYLEEQLTE